MQYDCAPLHRSPLRLLREIQTDDIFSFVLVSRSNCLFEHFWRRGHYYQNTLFPWLALMLPVSLVFSFASSPLSSREESKDCRLISSSSLTECLNTSWVPQQFCFLFLFFLIFWTKVPRRLFQRLCNSVYPAVRQLSFFNFETTIAISIRQLAW